MTSFEPAVIGAQALLIHEEIISTHHALGATPRACRESILASDQAVLLPGLPRGSNHSNVKSRAFNGQSMNDMWTLQACGHAKTDQELQEFRRLIYCLPVLLKTSLQEPAFLNVPGFDPAPLSHRIWQDAACSATGAAC